MNIYKRLFKIALPIAIQQIILTSMNFVDMLMIGQLGEVSIAAVGLSNQLFFIFNVVTFGLVSGGSIFIAQFWGTKQTYNISRTTALMLICSTVISVFFFVLAFFFPEQTLRVFSPDQQVISQGAGYLNAIGVSFLAFGITMTISFVLRNTENAVIPMIISIISIGLNVLLNYSLIFGHFGFPAMGIRGAGIGTLVSRMVEMSLILIILYWKKLPGRVHLEHFSSLSKDFVKRFLRYTFPTVANELFWSTGFSMYSIIYSYMGTSLLAATRIMSSIERFSFSVVLALANAAAVIIGQELGKSSFEQAKHISKKIIKLDLLIAFILMIPMILFAPQFVSLFSVTPKVKSLSILLLRLSMLYSPVKIMNGLFIVGFLRAGGDTKFSFAVEAGCLWLVGIPVTAVAGLIIGLPFPLVYSLCMVEETLKLIILIRRYRGGKWLKNVVENMQ
ncbi:MAG TPA: MATE family efflux transporter [Thermotogota bacterium]|nr:MATE family efflux transporter [Thermotogota bacterium]HPJ87877.1 MATE family efflux transporter [Thermotogota bacterium]HPR94970.1 MATE family efflux transporter [Thermotogota bacterium]